MKIIGICGTSGSGKSTVGKILAEMGVLVLDCDAIYHDLINSPSQCRNAIADEFGKELIQNGVLDRNALREIVFSDSDKLNRLNKISHFYVKEELMNHIKIGERKGIKICAIDAPMLWEAGLDSWCDLVCAVISEPTEQIRRICERDHITSEDAALRIQKQIPPSELERKADFVIQNRFDLVDLKEQCKLLLERVLQ